MIFIVKKMKKNINKITWACYLLALFWLGACTPNQVHNFQIDNIGMQNVSLDGWQGSNNKFYLMKIKLKHCNEYFGIGGIPYGGGILDSVCNIVIFDGKNEDVANSLKPVSSFVEDSVKTLWGRIGSKDFPCHYCLNVRQLQNYLNRMTVEVRGEYYSKEEDAHYMYRLFCVPKGQPLPKKLIFRFDKYSIECDVNNIPKRVKVTRIDKMEP